MPDDERVQQEESARSRGSSGRWSGVELDGYQPGDREHPEDQWQSKLVRYDAKYRLVYTADAEGNRIPDFSHAGYKNGDSPIPHVRTVKTIEPIEGDNTAHLQAAIDEVGLRTPDSTGFRGAVLLAPGNYPVAGTLRVNRSGVVLRGRGQKKASRGTTTWGIEGTSRGISEPGCSSLNGSRPAVSV